MLQLQLLQPSSLGDSPPAPHPPEGALFQAPASRAPARTRGLAGEGKGEAGLDLGPPTPFPFQFLVLLPSAAPPTRAPCLSPLQPGSLENQEVEKSRAWISQGHGPFPRDGHLAGRWVPQVLALPQVWKGKPELGGASLELGQEGPRRAALYPTSEP